MPTLKTTSAVIQGLFYVAAGRAHFTNPGFYLKIMPPYLPYHLELVYLSGAAEVLLGLGMFHPATRPYAAWGLLALLAAVFPANIYMATAGGLGFPPWLAWARLPVQALFAAWAYWHTYP